MKKPFSYYVPFTRFGSPEAIWDREGQVASRRLSDRNLRETEPQPPVVAAHADSGPTRAAAQGGRATAGSRPTPRLRRPIRPTRRCSPMPGPDAGPTRTTATPRFGPPFDPDGKRDLTWRPDGAGLSYLQLEPAKKDESADRKHRPRRPRRRRTRRARTA